MINENEQMIKEKLEFFLEEKVAVHVKKNDKQFLNGLIIEKKSDNIFVMMERKLGIVHLFVSDVYSVGEFVEVGSW